MEESYSIQLSKVIDKFNLETLYLPELPDKQPDASILANGEYVSEAEAVKEIRQHMKF